MQEGFRFPLRALALALAILIFTFQGRAAQPAASTPAGLRMCSASPAGALPGASPAAATPPPVTANEKVLQSVADVPLPGSASRFDYQSLDESTGRLVIAHMGADQVIVFDTRAQQVVGTVDGVKTPTGVLAVPAVDRIFAAAAGSHAVDVIDARALEVVAHAGEIGFPDGLAYAPTVKQVFISDESGGGELVIDAMTNRAVTTIDIGGEAGNTHYDPVSGCILVAVQDRGQLAVIDPASDRLVARYDLKADCQRPHGFLIDAPQRVAYVSCEGNAKLLDLDLRTMRVTATHAVGESPDVLAFDPGLRRLYVASESGIVSVFAETNRGLTLLGEYEAPHAHSVAVDPSTQLIYLPLENVDGKPVLRILRPAR
jgi:DNA-binding beta-propeller fold protein YncE